MNTLWKSVSLVLKSVLSVAAILLVLQTPAAQAFGANTTPLIVVNVDQSDTQNLIITYDIYQEFNEESRGVFLSLPKNQDGVWTNYTLLRAQKAKIQLADKPAISQFDKCSPTNLPPSTNEVVTSTYQDFIINNGSGYKNLTDEKYQNIHEWNQLRVRFGDADTLLERGIYHYHIELKASANDSYEHNLRLLHDWMDPVGYIVVFSNGDYDCFATNQQNSDEVKAFNGDISLVANAAKPPTSIFQKVLWSTWLYLLVAILLLTVGFSLWYVFARDPFPLRPKPAPVFQPPQEYPWEAAYLAKDGSTTVKNTLLSYILWLNTHKYITLKPDGDPHDTATEVTITIKKDLPKLLPDIFNTAVELSAKKGLKAGILESKLSEQTALTPLTQQLRLATVHCFTHSPISQGSLFGLLFGLGFALIAGSVVVFNFLQTVFLLGDSYIPILSLFVIGCEIIAIVVLINWSKPTKRGVELINSIRGYKYYLEYAEKLKLDFSNNPNDGVQYYLKSVAYAAAFGILPQFQSYFAQLIPNADYLQTNNSLLNTYSHVVFYVPPSSSQSGGYSGGGGGGFSGGGGSW